jgi:hypothetical protein
MQRVISGKSYMSQTSVTRPSNATPYTAGDVVGATAAAITFADIGPSFGCVCITDADIRVDVSSVPAGMTSFRLHLYDVTPPSALADNAVWDLPAGDRASYLGYIDLGTPVDVGSTLFVQSSGSALRTIQLKTPNVYGYLVTDGGYTPSSAAVKSIRLVSMGA